MTPSAISLSLRQLCAAALLFLAGCAHQLEFKVVDASSQNGLAEVSVKVRDPSNYFSRKPPHEQAAGLTDASGFITVPGVSSGQCVLFSKKGYRGAIAGFVEHGKIGFRPDPPLNVDTMWREQQTVDKGGVIVIPLLPERR